MNEHQGRHASAVRYWESIIERYVKETLDKPESGVLDSAQDEKNEKRGRAINPDRARIVRTWLKNHPDKWIRAAQMEEDLGLSPKYLGNVCKHLQAQGEPIESQRKSDRTEQYRWIGEK